MVLECGSFNQLPVFFDEQPARPRISSWYTNSKKCYLDFQLTEVLLRHDLQTICWYVKAVASLKAFIVIILLSLIFSTYTIPLRSPFLLVK